MISSRSRFAGSTSASELSLVSRWRIALVGDELAREARRRRDLAAPGSPGRPAGRSAPPRASGRRDPDQRLPVAVDGSGCVVAVDAVADLLERGRRPGRRPARRWPSARRCRRRPTAGSMRTVAMHLAVGRAPTSCSVTAARRVDRVALGAAAKAMQTRIDRAGERGRAARAEHGGLSARRRRRGRRRASAAGDRRDAARGRALGQQRRRPRDRHPDVAPRRTRPRSRRCRSARRR